MTTLAVSRGAVVLAVVLVLALVGCSTAGPPQVPGAGWRLDLHDSFSGSSLDRAKWGTCYWWGPDGCTIASNGEDEWYQADQVAVKNGQLELEAKPESTRHDGEHLTHVSGMVTTGRPGDESKDRARHAFTYGYVEVRFRTPKGQGLWPAIWMLPTTNKSLPEIDLLEQHGDEPTSASMTLHTKTSGDPRIDRKEVRTADLSEGWHTVGLDWTKGRLRWFIDGIEQFEVRGDQVPSEPMYLVMNLAVGGAAGAPKSTSTFPAYFLVDEVSVWQRT